MKIAQLTPGSGDNFYCENCLRDAALVRALRGIGHDAVMVPIYLPQFGENAQLVNGAPLFFGGINAYLQQKSALFRRTPRWLDRLFDSPGLLRFVARRAKTTRARDLGAMTVSMLRGEHGNQAKELHRLVGWLAEHIAPDVVVLSDGLLAGMARRIRQELGVPVVCLLQDEDGWLDAMPVEFRELAWATLRELVADVDAFVAVSDYYRTRLGERLAIPSGRCRVIPIGIDLAGYAPATAPPRPPTIGFLSRMSRCKGLDLLVEAFVRLKQRESLGELRLRVAGGQTADDTEFLGEVRDRLLACGLAGEAEFLPALGSTDRQAFLRTLTVLSVPSRQPEAFGSYILEAFAAGVPVVQPRLGAATEIIEPCGGGVLYEPNDPVRLADAIEPLLRDPAAAAAMGRRGRQAVEQRYTIRQMAADVAEVLESVVAGSTLLAPRDRPRDQHEWHE